MAILLQILLNFLSLIFKPICQNCEQKSVTFSCRNLYLFRDKRFINPLTPNDPYGGRTAPLTSKVAFYIFIQQI